VCLGSLEPLGRRPRLQQPAFTLPQLAEIAEVEYRTLHTWVARGLLRPSLRRSAGTGTPNLFGAQDAVAARVLADLRRAGLSMDVLECAGEALRDSAPALDQPAVLLVNGAVEVFPDAPSAAGALDRPGLSLVYRTREALERVTAVLSTD
jgi:DNA-binding transcriptional MerR regulator